MALRLIAAALAVVVAVTLGVRLTEHERCETARADVGGALARGAGAVPARDAALADLRDHCRGTASLTIVAGRIALAGDGATGLELAREATREEPDNPATWHALRATAANRAPADERRARRRLRELDPLGRGLGR